MTDATVPPAGQSQTTPPSATNPPAPTNGSPTSPEGAAPSAINSAPAAPAFDFSKVELPQGFSLSDEERTSFGALAAKHNADPAFVTALIKEFYIPAITKVGETASTAAQAAASETWTQTQTAWRADLEKSYGGTDKVVEAAKSFGPILDRFGGPVDKDGLNDLRRAMDLTGFGNHPAAFKFFAELAKVLNEPGPVKTGEASTPSGSPFASIYPTMQGTKK